jgi:hypothetical protein
MEEEGRAEMKKSGKNVCGIYKGGRLMDEGPKAAGGWGRELRRGKSSGGREGEYLEIEGILTVMNNYKRIMTRRRRKKICFFACLMGDKVRNLRLTGPEDMQVQLCG